MNASQELITAASSEARNTPRSPGMTAGRNARATSP